VTSQRLLLGIPKGSLEEATLALFHKVGLQFTTGSSRSLWLGSNDPEIVPVMLRPQEIPVYVESGRLDAGLAGLDWIAERDVEDAVTLLAELQYSKQTSRPIRWVLAVPNGTAISDVNDLRLACEERGVRGDPQFTIATELTRVSSLWLARNGIDARAEFSWGATEAKAGYFADAVIEATETGSSLRANGLRIIGEVFVSNTQLFANRYVYRTDPWKRDKLDGLSHLLVGALRADSLVQLTVVGDRELALSDILPADARIVTATGPTQQSPFHAVITLPKASVPQALPAVIAQGATDAWVSSLDIHYAKVPDQPAAVAENTRSVGPARRQRISVRSLAQQEGPPASELPDDIKRGFAKLPKELPPKYLYAIGGSDIFEKITQLPEYYVTRAETEALRLAAAEIICRGDWSDLIELGPGSGKKARYLLEPMLRRGPVTYKPVDLEEPELMLLADSLIREYSGLEVAAFVGDFVTAGLGPALAAAKPQLLAFLGSTLGNLTPPQRSALFESFVNSAPPGSGFLVGVDLVKDQALIEAAYNDAAGVTADFDLNVLRVLRRDVGAHLDPDDFSHRAVYDAEQQRIEMRLYASRDMTMAFDNEGLPDYSFAAGEYILTELSYKFTRDGLTKEFSGAGLRILGWWTDPDQQVALALAGI